MNAWPLVFGLITLSACADPATSQQSPDVVTRSGSGSLRQTTKPLVPNNLSQHKVEEETGMDMDEAARKIDEITERLDYLRRYIGPSKK